MKTMIYFYKYDCHIREEATAYEALCRELQDMRGRGCWMHCVPTRAGSYALGLNGKSKEIVLETEQLFDNQWNSEIGRVFDWYEEIVPNNMAWKAGHYLGITPEMRAIRHDTMACGYCGRQFPYDASKRYHEECLHNVWLTADNIPLLRFRRIDETELDEKRNAMPEEEIAALLQLHVEARLTLKPEDSERQRQEVRSSYAKQIHNAQLELDGTNWLLDHGIGEEAMYCSYTKTWRFGWRHTVSQVLADELKKRLEGFPFQYEIEVAK